MNKIIEFVITLFLIAMIFANLAYATDSPTYTVGDILTVYTEDSSYVYNEAETVIRKARNITKCAQVLITEVQLSGYTCTTLALPNFRYVTLGYLEEHKVADQQHDCPYTRYASYNYYYNWITPESCSGGNSFAESESKKLQSPVNGGCVDTGSSAGIDTGEYFQSQKLFTLQGPPLSASMKINYRSNGLSGSLGKGWRHKYDIGLRNDGNNNIVARFDTSERLYTLSDGAYISEVDDYSTLVENSDDTYTLTEKSGLEYDFSETGKCTTITDRNGNQILFEYNEDDILQSVTDSADREIDFIYNDDNTLAAISDPMGNTFLFGYTGGLLTIVTYPDGAIWNYTYDDDGYLETKTDPEGNTTSYELDDNHRLIQSTDPNGRTRSLSYSDNSTTFTEKDGGERVYNYNKDAGVLLSKTDAEGFTTSYTWDSDKNLLTRTDPGNVVATYTYDSRGNVMTATDALNHVTTFTYNDFGQIMTATSPRGTLTDTYDANGNLTQVENYDGSLTQFEYNSRGQVAKVTDALSRETNFTYDDKGLLQTATPSSGVTRSTGFDTNGNLLTLTIDGRSTTYTYDTMNRVSAVTDPLGNVTDYGYDGNGNTAHTVDPESQSTLYVNNYEGRVTQIQDAKGGIATFVYGGSGCTFCGGVDKLTSLTDPEGETTSFEYSQTGHLTQKTDPFGNIIQYSYDDGRSNLTSRTDANHQTVTYNYDDLNRLIQANLPGSKTITYTYDSTTGDLTSVVSPEIGYTYTYDTLGRVTGVTDTRGYSLSYTYNSLGQRIQVTLPGDETIVYSYDIGNRLSTMSTEAGDFTFGYDSGDRLSSFTYPNGITTDYGYDDAGHITSMVSSGTRGDVLNIAYPSLDGLGNRLEKSQNGISTTYNYDELYRLVSDSTGIHDTKSYTYDNVGDRLTGPLHATYEYDDGHELTRGGDGAIYTYDGNGNPVTRKDRKENWDYTWDALGRLTQIVMTEKAETKTVNFTYDPFGRRIEKEAVSQSGRDKTTTTTDYVYDDEDIVLQVETFKQGNHKTTTETRFIHSPGVDEPLAFVRDGKSYFYHADGLGSIIEITDSRQRVVQKYDYDSFGMPRIENPAYSHLMQTPGMQHSQALNKSKSNNASDKAHSKLFGFFESLFYKSDKSMSQIQTNASFIQPYAFSGREWDGETGLYFYRTRYYNPQEGRFLSRDPIGFAGGDYNLYGYVQNDPVNFTDPNGEFINLGAAAVGAAIGAAVGATNALFNHGDVLKGALSGSVVGSLAGLTFGTSLIANAAIGAGIGAISDIASQRISNPCGNINGTSVAISALAGAIGGGAGTAMLKGGATAIDAALFSGALAGGTSMRLNYAASPGPTMVPYK